MELSDRIEGYIEKHIDGESDLLRRIERRSYLRMVNGRMCSGHLQGRVLAMLSRMIRPRRILEIGTFTGYSALCLAEGLSEDGELLTIEIFDENEDLIRENFSDSPLSDKLHLLLGDAIEIMPGLERESFDLIFIDADKRYYPQYYELGKRLLRPGGYIIADNTLWDGHVTDPERTDPQTLGVKNFNDLVADDRVMKKVILPLRDGLTIIHRPE